MAEATIDTTTDAMQRLFEQCENTLSAVEALALKVEDEHIDTLKLVWMHLRAARTKTSEIIVARSRDEAAR